MIHGLARSVFHVALIVTLAQLSLGGKRSTDDLIDNADAIVVGELQSGRQNGQSVVFTLNVSRTLKGELAPGASIQVAGMLTKGIIRELKGQYGIWFLKSAGTYWQLQPVMPGGASLESAGYYPLSKGNLTTSLAISSSPATANDRLAIELIAGLQNTANPTAFYTLSSGLLDIGDSTVTSDLYRFLRASNDPQLKFVGLAGLWGTGDDLSALTEIVDNMDIIPRLYVRQHLGRRVLFSSGSESSGCSATGRPHTIAEHETMRRGCPDEYSHTRRITILSSAPRQR